MQKYNHQQVEKKWQDYWDKDKTFEVEENFTKPKYYSLCMFPYPSGAGLHVGHPESYTAVDIVARYRRMKCEENVLNPMGFDAFGLPTENYAIKVGKHPRDVTKENINNFIRQLKSFGFSYDWSRQIVTSDPKYYKWTQWMFRELYKQGLAYKKKAPVNWCESCKTVLAREQVIDGKCERCKNEVIQKNLSQWFFKVTKYADELLEEIEKLDWPEPIKALQRNWIGRSEGASVQFKIKDSEENLEIFTTRPDTLFGATFMVVAPEHSLIEKNKNRIENLEEIEAYIEQAQKKNELERTDLNKHKTGVELKGIMAINPVNNEEIPIFVADYVMMNYGTGAIMAVPGHDERDFEFALTTASSETGKPAGVFIKNVVRPKDKKELLTLIDFLKEDKNGEDKLEEYFQFILQGTRCFSGEGVAVNSGEFNGLSTNEFKKKIIIWLEERNLGERQIQYKLRDWLVSRQRYWGAPIPIIYCPDCGEVLVDEKDLPVELPDDVDFKPTGESPLATSKRFHDVKCPKCGKTDGVEREVDTMDTFVCSSWYFLRYPNPNLEDRPFDKEKIEYWLPVDLYVGGAEHAVLHLMYARFFTKALCDMGHINFREPFLKLRNQGMILAEDGRKMSKSLGNVINPDNIVKEYGADTFRMYEMFMGPLEDTKPWNTNSIAGVRRFLEKVWKYFEEYFNYIKKNRKEDLLEYDNLHLIHKAIKKVTGDIENMKFNTAISGLMILFNNLKTEKVENSIISQGYKFFGKKYMGDIIILLSPFAPHICEELWEKLGHKESIIKQKWPVYDPELIKEDEIELVLQVNGKVRDKIIVTTDISEDEAKQKALASDKINKWLSGKEPKKIVFIKGRLVNFVV